MAGKQENMILYVVIAIMAIIIIYMVMNKSNNMQENFYFQNPSPNSTSPLVNNQEKYDSGYYHGQTLAKFYYRTVLSSLDNGDKWDNAFVLGTFDGLKNLIDFYFRKINEKKPITRTGKKGGPFRRNDPTNKWVKVSVK
jgi:hypothetical protein